MQGLLAFYLFVPETHGGDQEALAVADCALVLELVPDFVDVQEGGGKKKDLAGQGEADGDDGLVHWVAVVPDCLGFYVEQGELELY